MDRYIKVLGSSSKGNEYILSVAGEVLLLEAGISLKEVKKALDFNLRNISGCLVTHEHGDHAKYVNKFIDSGIDVYSSKGTFEALGLKDHRTIEVESEKMYKIGNFKVMPFNTKHDCAEPFGYLINHKEIGNLLFATDTYYLEYTFPDLKNVLIECNYSEEIMTENINNGSVNKFLANRVRKSHFGLENVIGFLEANDISKLDKIIIIHLSSLNSNEKQFVETIQKNTGITTYAANTGKTFELRGV